MEQSSTRPKDDSAADAAEQVNARKEKANKSASILKTTGKTIGRGLGLDVILKDSKRIRSRFPNLWADIFSGRWRDVDNEHKEISSANKTSAVAAVLTAMTVCMAVYWIFLFVTALQHEVVRWMPMVALSILVVAGTIQSGCYWYIAALQRRQSKRRTPKKTDPRKTKKQGRTT